MPWNSAVAGMAQPGPAKWNQPPPLRTAENTVVFIGSAWCAESASSGPTPVTCACGTLAGGSQETHMDPLHP